MRTALRANDKLGSIADSLTKPTMKEDDAPGLQAWDTPNSMVSSWILNVIDPRLRTSIANTDTKKPCGMH